jgi:uncharacterized protein (TIGR00369 family)
VSAPATVRERTFSWQDPMALAGEAAQLPGLDYLRGIADGTLPPPPVAAMMGFEIAELEPGRAVFAMEPGEWLYNPIGSVHGGVVATLLDSCMGCAVHTMLDAGVGYTTTDLQVRYLRAVGVDSGRVLAEGRTVHCGQRMASAEGRMWAESDPDRLLATATTGAVILR